MNALLILPKSNAHIELVFNYNENTATVLVAFERSYFVSMKMLIEFMEFSIDNTNTRRISK